MAAVDDLPLDKAKQALKAFIARYVVGNRIVGPRVDYLAFYPCAVKSQNSDGSSTQSGTLELTPDDVRLGSGFSRVKLRVGIPGCVVTLSTPTRVLLGWDVGDPTKPYASLFDSSTVSKISIVGSEVDIGAASPSDFMLKGTSEDNALRNFMSALNTFSAALKVLAQSNCVNGSPLAGSATFVTAEGVFEAAISAYTAGSYLSTIAKVG